MQGLVKRKDIGIEKESVKMRFSSSKNVLNPSKLPDRNDELCVCTKEKSFIIIVILFTSSAYVNTTCTLPQVLYAAILGTHTHTHTHTLQSDSSHTQTDLVRQPASAEQVKWHIGGDSRVKEETRSSGWSWEMSSGASGQHSSAASSFSAHSNLAAYGSSISCGQTGREHQAATVIYFSLGLAALCRCHSLSVCLSVSVMTSLILSHTPHLIHKSPARVYSTSQGRKSADHRSRFWF